MSILPKLATSLGHSSDVANQLLAKQIASEKNTAAVEELVANLTHKNKSIQSDCIKTLYELGFIAPVLIAPHYQTFLALLNSKNNRLQWGAMIALDTITPTNPKAIYSALDTIIGAANAGSVITKDHAVNILIALCTHDPFKKHAFELLNEQLLNNPINQLPKYAEQAMVIAETSNQKQLLQTLAIRLKDVTKDTQKKRLEKVIAKLTSR